MNAVQVAQSSIMLEQVLHSSLVGMLANGPLLHLFFEVMERLICFKSELCNVLCKIVVDQVGTRTRARLLASHLSSVSEMLAYLFWVF